ncbi:MAG: hypothetical protein C5B44_01110, partial [Acidobacteria bacterium]
PFIAEPEIPAKFSADPVALTEVEEFTPDEVLLQEPGRDLRPDTVTPAPDITSTGAAALDHLQETGSEIQAEVIMVEESTQTLSASETSEAASDGSNDDEKQNASPDAAE